MRQDYELLKKEASDLASKVDNIIFAWSCDQATGEEYGLLAEIIGDIKYTHLTNLNWAQEMEPATYDPAITAATATHTRKRLEEEWEEKYKSWFIQKGFLRGVTMNMRNVLDKQYYSQLKHINTAYRNSGGSGGGGGGNNGGGGGERTFKFIIVFEVWGSLGK
jgi:hypothetical protein